MATTADSVTVAAVVQRRPVGHRFYRGMALLIMGLSIAGFGPSILDASTRNVPLPLTGLVTTHAILSGAWLLLFFIQATLVATGRTPVHRRLGILGGALALVFLVQSYVMALEAARRGFDLTRTVNAQLDPLGALLARLGLLLEFGVLVLAVLWYRHRPDIHRRLMLLATLGPLAVAPTAHLVRHWLPPDPAGGATIGVVAVLLLSASAVHDRLSRGRIHPVSLWVPISLFAWQIATARVLPTVAPLREFGAWLIR